MNNIKRETAVICKVEDLLSGSFVKTEGWNPSYISTSIGNLSRVNIMGVIVSKGEDGIWLDDGSGRIMLRSFEGNALASLDVGDFVMVIGRPRAYNEQKYVVPEIARKVDSRWGEFRKAQFDILRKEVKTAPKPEKRVVVSESAPAANHFQRIMDFIKDLDSGEGADVDVLLKRLSLDNGEDLVRKLIEEGEIFEIKPGRLKLLE